MVEWWIKQAQGHFDSDKLVKENKQLEDYKKAWKAYEENNKSPKQAPPYDTYITYGDSDITWAGTATGNTPWVYSNGSVTHGKIVWNTGA